ncbi:Icc protein [Nicoletella semolina]|uniref:3',5'-cyclic adenosine monophosphate phosphodiesterase CpdA n=1 Tax=Nicoletella semolina TaxID=271160 RepID=A0A4V2SJX9_9PAST|nr:3',5'-cyclic-AMP phosphodiesterase [Nicoletella semolina]MDH2924536.1 3',5'-cyclic-AMP phosphodiesterase [Nicoletella semolina]TCP17336.1 Icc protein [Nicoletella semolina]
MESYSFPDLNQVIKIIQITDTHLLANGDQELLGVNTAKSFQAVIDGIHRGEFAYDFILATGDLAQDQCSQAYTRFAEMVKPLEKPVFWLEGNHDIQPAMYQGLTPFPQIQSEKHILMGEKWQVLLLDSHIPTLSKGELSQDQLNWLARKLEEYSERFTLIALHHNILPTNSAWLDQHSLANSEALTTILAQFSKVKAILYGHIHQEVDRFWLGYRVLATPSTCIQFKPNCDRFTLDPMPQGWREISLFPDGNIETTVRRLNENNFLPNFHATGY